ncbi:hypothetical protein Q8A67_021532 [Cirrhinus molitorella]|uniref:Uncharacterized protein n=1 Tax=Cirrhinus molitorella TaxID=172907 RepID=A0AA88P3S3_9TELE|nr:hypothetical protein Q8A67_021532 [Cirrhinus molitorella]
MARAGSLPAECSFSIFILHLLRDGQGGRMTPLPCFGDDGIRENEKCSPPPPKRITLPQQCLILHNRRKTFDSFLWHHTALSRSARPGMTDFED